MIHKFIWGQGTEKIIQISALAIDSTETIYVRLMVKKVYFHYYFDVYFIEPSPD